MKSINLLSLSQAHESLDPDEYKSFKEHYEIDIDDDEINDVKTLINEILPILSFVNTFNDFYVGYKIQHISKEFDLLRFGSNFILNIEVKSENTEKKIKKQLTRNRYYLHHINKVIHNYCFVATSKTLYQLGESGDIEIVALESLVQLLTSQNLIKLDSPDTLFNPSDYLVSPFNSTAKFLAGQYFLTGQQETIKNQITKNIKGSSSSVVSLTGGAGTGKTLLTYDIVKSRMETMKTIVVHCGQLNDGHQRLINSGWNVVSIKDFRNYDLTNVDLVVVDETQRIHSNQFDNLVEEVKSKNTHCIFSYDKQQTLSRFETYTNIEGKINAISGAYKYSLSDKIRTNKEIANFIKVLFDNKRNNITVSNCGNIDFDYFTDLSNVKNYISLISGEGWEVLRLTPSQYQNEHHESYSQISSQNSHRVIGQEFDNVAVVIDEYFSYGADGKLIYTARTYYDSVKMLFQNITRTRKKLKLIIIGNRQILNRCLSVMK